VEVTQEALSWELRRAPVPSELAEKMNLPLEQVTRLLRVLGEPMSLELMNEQEGEDASCLPDVGQDPEDLAMTAGLRRVIAAALLGITAREERIVRLRFGMNLKSDLTLEEIGRPWDITRERVRQIEAAALRKLKHPSRSRRLRQFLESEA
jgi:RNA polymerase primary sigma factor